MMTQKHRRTR